MALMLIFFIFILILERYVNRCDTKAVETKTLDDVTENKSFFSKKEMGF